MEIVNLYSSTVAALGVLGGLMLTQFLIADFTGIKRKHVPGETAVANHDDFLFRATRVVANTNESIGMFLVLLAFCVFSSVSPSTTSLAAWTFVGIRFVYALCYYLDIRVLRSIVFGLSLLVLLALLVAGTLARI